MRDPSASPEFSKAFSGKIWILGDDIDTDLIVPSRVLTEQDPKKLLDATLEVVIPNFAKLVTPGDIMVAGRNFGCGSSREEAVFVLKSLGIHVVIARSFPRIFYRNMINLGLIPLIVLDLVTDVTRKQSTLGGQGDLIQIDLPSGKIWHHNQSACIQFPPFPTFIQDLLAAGGALAKLKQSLTK